MYIKYTEDNQRRKQKYLELITMKQFSKLREWRNAKKLLITSNIKCLNNNACY